MMGTQRSGLILCLSVFTFVSGCTNKNASIEASFGKGDKMAKKVLVAYGSFSGSTAETAVFIGKKLAEKGMTADVKPVEKIKSIEGYNAVIIGSAIMMGKMKSSVIKFAEKNREALGRVPVAVFLVCLTMAKDTPENRKTASGYLDPLKAIVKPVSEGLFPGRDGVRRTKGESHGDHQRIGVGVEGCVCRRCGISRIQWFAGYLYRNSYPGCSRRGP